MPPPPPHTPTPGSARAPPSQPANSHSPDGAGPWPLERQTWTSRPHPPTLRARRCPSVPPTTSGRHLQLEGGAPSLLKLQENPRGPGGFPHNFILSLLLLSFVTIIIVVVSSSSSSFLSPPSSSSSPFLFSPSLLLSLFHKGLIYVQPRLAGNSLCSPASNLKLVTIFPHC